MDFEAVADELYGAPLADFTALRNQRSKEAKQAGRTDDATAIGKLAKPNIVAWLANQLVREHGEEITPLLELGTTMREATANLAADDLRQLSKQQHQIVHALVQQARKLGAASGQKVSASAADELSSTLTAALSDEELGEQLATGRLTGALEFSGFPGLASSSGPSLTLVRGGGGTRPKPAAKPRSTTAAKADDDAARKAEIAAARKAEMAQARADEKTARRAAEDAADDLEAAHAALDGAVATAEEAIATIARLKAELDEAGVAKIQAERDQRQAQRDLDRAERMAQRTATRLDSAGRRLDELTD